MYKSTHLAKKETGRAPAIRGGLSFSAVLSLIFSVCACHPRGALPAYWAYRVFSGPWGIVMVRASWPGHPTLIQKKKKKRMKGSG